jgi:hypothetical protein
MASAPRRNPATPAAPQASNPGYSRSPSGPASPASSAAANTPPTPTNVSTPAPHPRRVSPRSAGRIRPPSSATTPAATAICPAAASRSGATQPPVACRTTAAAPAADEPAANAPSSSTAAVNAESTEPLASRVRMVVRMGVVSRSEARDHRREDNRSAAVSNTTSSASHTGR